MHARNLRVWNSQQAGSRSCQLAVLKEWVSFGLRRDLDQQNKRGQHLTSSSGLHTHDCVHSHTWLIKHKTVQRTQWAEIHLNLEPRKAILFGNSSSQMELVEGLKMVDARLRVSTII